MVYKYQSLYITRSYRTLYFNNKPIHFEPPVYGENVQVDTSGTNTNKTNLLKQNSNNMEQIAIVNMKTNLALDDYEGHEPGPIKWWSLYPANNGNFIPKDNQWFTITYL